MASCGNRGTFQRGAAVRAHDVIARCVTAHLADVSAAATLSRRGSGNAARQVAFP